MKINKLIEVLKGVYAEHGNLTIIGNDDDEISFAEVQKSVLTSCDYNDIVTRHTEDLDEDYLEKVYKDDPNFIKKEICLKIY